MRLSEDKDYVSCHQPLLYPWDVAQQHFWL